jgi:hypothetical protein
MCKVGNEIDFQKRDKKIPKVLRWIAEDISERTKSAQRDLNTKYLCVIHTHTLQEKRKNNNVLSKLLQLENNS